MCQQQSWTLKMNKFLAKLVVLTGGKLNGERNRECERKREKYRKWQETKIECVLNFDDISWFVDRCGDVLAWRETKVRERHDLWAILRRTQQILELRMNENDSAEDKRNKTKHNTMR